MILLEVPADSSLARSLISLPPPEHPVHLRLVDDLYELWRWSMHSDGTLTTWWRTADAPA